MNKFSVNYCCGSDSVLFGDRGHDRYVANRTSPLIWTSTFRDTLHDDDYYQTVFHYSL